MNSRKRESGLRREKILILCSLLCINMLSAWKHILFSRLRLSNAELLQMVEELVTIVEERRLTQRQDNLDKIVTAGVKKWQRVIAKHKK